MHGQLNGQFLLDNACDADTTKLPDGASHGHLASPCIAACQKCQFTGSAVAKQNAASLQVSCKKVWELLLARTTTGLYQLQLIPF